jgi:formate dehydrogenase subunit delta
VSATKIDKLVHMANQIGDYFAAMPDPEGVDGVAEHLRLYWTPKMIGEIVAHGKAGGAGLKSLAARAVAKLGDRTIA